MKYHTLLIPALFASLLIGCSKHSSPPAASPGVVDFGVVQVSDTGTNHFDSDLGSNQVCIVRSFIIKQPTGEQMVVSSAEIAARDSRGDHMLISFDALTNSPDQPVEFSNGYYHIRVQPHIKP